MINNINRRYGQLYRVAIQDNLPLDEEEKDLLKKIYLKNLEEFKKELNNLIKS